MSREVKSWLVPVALALLLVLAGCSGGAGDAAQTAGGNDGGEKGAQERQAADDSQSDSQGANTEVRQRSVIRTGTVAIRVDSYDNTRSNLTQATRQFGGYVSDSSEQVHTRENQTWATGRVVLRVPKENFSALLTRAKEAGEVQKAGTSSNDVTDKLVDIEARLTNLKAQRDRLRDLYEEANDTENVLAVQERLSEVQTEIERLEAKRKSLERQVAYSTITVELNEERPERDDPNPDEDQWYETGLFAAFTDSVNGVVVVLRSLAVMTAYAAPYVLAFGVPLGGGYAIWRRRNGATSGQVDTERTDSPTEAE